MTIIEFFDSTPIHNAAGMLLLAPDEVVLVGEKSVPMHAFRSRLEKIIKAHGLTTKIHVESVDTRNFPKLIEKLESILLSYRDCAFDLTGGQTEILVAMGALSQKYGLPMHTVDPVRGTVSPFTCKETYPAARTASLSISENIALYDGKVAEALTPPDEEAFWQDVLAVWSVASRDPAAWNSAISTLHAFCDPEEMFAEIRMWEVSKKFPAHRVDTLRKIITALQKAGCLTGYREKGDCFSFRYKSEAVQLALMKEGSCLELYVYYAAHIFENTVFTDAAAGVVIDWDTLPSPFPRDDVKNEIDVFLMERLTPVFISCKNGFVDSDELYKLSVVASRFGGAYAKKLIVLTGHIPDASFIERAAELGISILQGAHLLPTKVLAKDIQTAIQK